MCSKIAILMDSISIIFDSLQYFRRKYIIITINYVFYTILFVGRNGLNRIRGVVCDYLGQVNRKDNSLGILYIALSFNRCHSISLNALPLGSAIGMCCFCTTLPSYSSEDPNYF